MLAYFDEKAPKMLNNDASNVGLEAVLMQCQVEEERVIAYVYAESGYVLKPNI